MICANSNRASFDMSSGEMRLVTEGGRVLLRRTLPAPERVAIKRWSYSPIAKVRAEFIRYAVKHGIEIVEWGAA